MRRNHGHKSFHIPRVKQYFHFQELQRVKKSFTNLPKVCMKSHNDQHQCKKKISILWEGRHPSPTPPLARTARWARWLPSLALHPSLQNSWIHPCPVWAPVIGSEQRLREHAIPLAMQLVRTGVDKWGYKRGPCPHVDWRVKKKIPFYFPLHKGLTQITYPTPIWRSK